MLRIRFWKFSLRMPWQAPVILVAIVVIVASFVFTRDSGTPTYAGQGEATNSAQWEAANEGIDWVSPDIVFVGHLTTELTKPLLPNENIVCVEDTHGFREEGWVKVRSESIHYNKRTPKTFEGCERSGDIKTVVNVGTIVGMLERGYYVKGTTESYTIRFHCGTGEQECTDMWTVETWVDETKCWIPMKSILADGDLSTVVVISNMAGDNVKATRYDSERNEIYVEGLKSDAKRVLTVRYQGMPTASWYTITVRPPDNVFEDYSMSPAEIADWVTISTNRAILLNPGDTQEIQVDLCIPAGAVTPSQRFMFWVWIAEQSDAMFGNAVAVTWLVNMGR